MINRVCNKLHFVWRIQLQRFAVFCKPQSDWNTDGRRRRALVVLRIFFLLFWEPRMLVVVTDNFIPSASKCQITGDSQNINFKGQSPCSLHDGKWSTFHFALWDFCPRQPLERHFCSLAICPKLSVQCFLWTCRICMASAFVFAFLVRCVLRDCCL